MHGKMIEMDGTDVSDAEDTVHGEIHLISTRIEHHADYNKQHRGK